MKNIKRHYCKYPHATSVTQTAFCCFSIDAYRSTRVKETTRPHVKQVIVRKEDVKQRAAETELATPTNHVSVKQKIKVRRSPAVHPAIDGFRQQFLIIKATLRKTCPLVCYDGLAGIMSQSEWP